MSIESWKSELNGLKSQLSALRMWKSDAMKNLSDIIAAQSDPARKRDYREQKKNKKEEWDSKINYMKNQIETHKRNKPQR
jgi:hypothetical protein